MKAIMITLMLFFAFNALGEVTSTLKSSIASAKKISPTLYRQIEGNLEKIKNSCDQAQEVLAQNQGLTFELDTKENLKKRELIRTSLHTSLARSVQSVKNKIQRASHATNSCMKSIFHINPADLLIYEAVNYLEDVQLDIRNSDFDKCSQKIGDVLSSQSFSQSNKRSLAANKEEEDNENK